MGSVRCAAAAALVGAATAGLLCAAPGSASAGVVHTHRLHGLSAAGSYATRRSLNWAGYIKTGRRYTSVSASWRVPTVRTSINGYSSTWVGVDGAASGHRYLLQTGTEQDVVRGRASYYGWYEVITPTSVAPEQRIGGMTIHPGDSMTATLTRNGRGSWTFSLRDNTLRETGTLHLAYAGPGRSAEWIQEDTEVNGTISAAPDWQSVTFTNATVNGAGADLAYRQAVNIVDTRGTVEASTGRPVNGNAFTVTWLAPGLPTNVG
jgi:hypothetical protein